MNSSSAQNFLQILDAISEQTTDDEVVVKLDSFFCELFSVAAVEKHSLSALFAGQREFLVTFANHDDAACAGVALNSRRSGRFRRHGYYGLVISLD